MDNSKEIFFKITEKVDSLRISKKDKQEILDDICDLLLEYEKEIRTETYKSFNEKIDKRLTAIEEFFKEDIQNVDCDVEIKCPYCNKSVQIYMNKKKMDVRCPICKKTIELEWCFENKK